jgi:hypothetical protein
MGNYWIASHFFEIQNPISISILLFELDSTAMDSLQF